MGWVKEALLKGELKITENGNCPFCNPEHKTNVETKINACEEHKWVYKTWYENTFKKQKPKSVNS
jgi:ribosomal protein L37AE/L43A